MASTILIVRRSVLVAVALSILLATQARAHCDGMDGPVVMAAQKALEKGDVNLVLVWVQKADEDEIRRAFERTLAVRTLNAEAKDLADTYFFETLVRIHRAGEGAAYTGLKPAGRDLGPAIPLADQALNSGEADALVSLITDETRARLSEAFDHAAQLRQYESADVEAGREYVKAYVAFIHYAERAYEVAHHPVAGHFPDDSHTPDHDE